MSSETATSSSVTAVCSRSRSASASDDDARAGLSGGGPSSGTSRARSAREAQPVDDRRSDVPAADELGQRRREGRVRRADDGVAVPVQHRRTAGGEPGRELPGEPALARARLTRDQRRTASFADGTRQQRAQLRQLARAPGERVRRRKAERPGRCAVRPMISS